MNKLPSEILYQIFSFLNQEQNLECMHVCRFWARTIRSSNLFRTVRIFTMNGLNKLVERVQTGAEKGSKVEHLIFNMSIDNTFDMSLIPILFPKVRTFYLYNCKDKHNLEGVNMDLWKKHITCFLEYTSSHLAFQLLSSGLCPRLNVLSVDITLSDRDFIPLLENAPYLEKLKIVNLRVTVDQLELLHTNLPYLQSLSLQSPQLRGGMASNTIHPTSSLKVLKVESSDVFFIQTQIAFLQYFSEKYTNLMDFSYTSACFDFREEEMNMLCRNGWIPLFEILGSRLKSINIDSNGVPANIYNILDSTGCQLDNLYLEESSLKRTLESFMWSRQIKYIRTLVLLNHGIGYTGFDWLKELKHLKELKVICVYDTIVQFDHLLNVCSDTIESLSIENGKLELDHSFSTSSRIKSLSFSKIFLPEAMDHFISGCFTRLKTLKLNSCFLYRRSFVLPLLDLSYFELTDIFPQNRSSILIETLNNGKKRWYNTKNRMVVCGDYQDQVSDISLYPNVKSMPYESLTTTPFITLICNTIENVVIYRQ